MYDETYPGTRCARVKSGCTPKSYIKPKYPNLETVGRGIDLMKFDPLSNKQDGLRNAIFEVFGVNGRGDCTEGYGYSVTKLYNCKAGRHVRKHRTMFSLMEEMKQVSDEEMLLEEPDLDITSMEKLGQNIRDKNEVVKENKTGQQSGGGGSTDVGITNTTNLNR